MTFAFLGVRMQERRERIQAPSLRWLTYVCSAPTRTLDNASQIPQSPNFIVPPLPVLGSRLYRYNKYNALPKISEKRIYEKSIFSQHVPGHVRLNGDASAHYPKRWIAKVAALFSALSTDHERCLSSSLSPSRLALITRPSLVAAQVALCSTEWPISWIGGGGGAHFEDRDLGSQVGVGRRCRHFLWYLCVDSIRTAPVSAV